MTAKVWNKRDPNVPPGAVYVGRPSKLGNPFTIGWRNNMREDVVMKFFNYLFNQENLYEDIRALKGKDLVCWCAPQLCHADVLLALANKQIPPTGDRDLIGWKRLLNLVWGEE